MATKRVRNYSREYARRNELARLRGEPSYAVRRRKIEQGIIAAIAPWRIRSKRTAENQEALKARTAAEAREATQGKTYADIEASVTKEERCRQWSTQGGSRTSMTKYNPREARKLGYAKEEYTDIYFRAFVSGDESYRKVRYKGGSDPLKEWFVTMHNIYQAGEYDGRYAAVN